jgi:hypothetical protein
MWSTLQEVFDQEKIESYKYRDKPAVVGADMVLRNEGAPVKGGDTLILLNGHHGKVYANEYYNQEFIYIQAQTNHTPTLESMHLRSSSKWEIAGISISPEYAANYERQTLINVESHGWTGPSREITLKNNTLFSVTNTDNWTIENWNNLPCSGMQLDGPHVIAEGNYLKNVNFGISSSGDSSIIRNNTIENFAGDGLRGLGNYSLFEYNTVKNCYDVNENHDDGFQSWSVGENGVGTGVVRGVILRGNVIINYEDPNQPFRGPLQGIGCFDGMFADWIVENNIIMVDHWHGITFMGTENMRVINNTVIDLNDESPGPPWINVTAHKDGRPPINNVVRNNLSTRIVYSDEGVIYDHNVLVDDYESFFVDYSGRDLHLQQNCEAVGAGSTEDAPITDQEGNLRISDSMDAGALAYSYEAPTLLRSISLKSNNTSARHSLRTVDGRYCSENQKSEFIPVYSLPKSR